MKTSNPFLNGQMMDSQKNIVDPRFEQISATEYQ